MKKQEINELLMHTELDKIISFVAEYAEEDNYFYEKIKKVLLPDKEETCDIEYYREKAESCFDSPNFRGRRRYHYDFYEAAYEAASGLDSIINDADFYAGQGNYADAAAMSMAIAEVIPRNYENVDDSSGKLAGTFNSAIELLCKIVNNSTVALSIKKEIYDWSKDEVSNSVYSDYGFDEIQSIYEACYEQLGDTDEVLADIEEQINEGKSEYQKSEAVLRKIRFMQSRNMDVSDVIQTHLDLNEVRKIYFQQLVNAKKYDEALRIATQGIEIAKQSYPGTVSYWKESIFEIYLKQGDTANLLPMAEHLLLHVSYGKHTKEEFYNILKTYTLAANWPDTMERLLTAAENERYFDSFIVRIMHEHQLWSRLFAYCKKGSIADMEQCENDLKPHFENEILTVYKDYVEKQALITSQHAYLEVARILTRMRTFANGNELVNQLLEKYRTMYKRRRNMMAALKGV